MKHILFICAFGFSISGFAQRVTTLEQCKEAALKNNLKLQNSELEVQMAECAQKEAFTGFFPQVSASGGIFQGIDPIVQADMHMAQGVDIPLSLVEKGATASVTAIQPIFAGMRIYNGNKLAGIQQEAASLKYGIAQDEVMQKTVDYYWQIIALKSELKTLQVVDKQLEGIYQQVETAVHAGMSSRNDLLRVELRRQELAGNRLKVENGLDLLEVTLAKHIGVCRDSLMLENCLSESPESPYTYYVDPEVAVSGRKEYKLSQMHVNASRYQVRMERGKYLPTLSIGIGDLYYNVMDKNVNNGIVFASVSIPISSWWGGSHAIQRARLQRVQAENSYLDAQNLLVLDIERTWNELNETYEQIQIAKHSVKSATENLRLNEDYFKAGTITLTELLEAEALYAKSYSKMTSTCADYQRKLHDYLLKTK